MRLSFWVHVQGLMLFPWPTTTPSKVWSDTPMETPVWKYLEVRLDQSRDCVGVWIGNGAYRYT
jgi:hypothetical protein